MRGEAFRHLHTPICSNSLPLVVNTKAKEDFQISVILLIVLTNPLTKEQFHNYRRPVTAHYLNTVIILSQLTVLLHIFYHRPYCYSITQKPRVALFFA